MSVESETAKQRGMDALRRGDPREALVCFADAIRLGERDPQMLLSTAVNARAAGQHQLAFDASDLLIETHGHMWQVNLLKADAMRELGNARDANSFYLAALNKAPVGLSPADQAELDRARRIAEDSAREYQDKLFDRLKVEGLARPAPGSRIDQAFEVMLGRQRTYLQQPQKFYFPELPQRQTFDRTEFAWAGEIEAATDAIRAELLGILEGQEAFVPYVRRNPDAPPLEDKTLQDNNDWGAFHLVNQGRRVEANIDRAARTMTVLDTHVPLPDLPGLGPAVLFSRLRPGTHITPHHGMTNARLLCHLPLIVPPGCEFRVGNQRREWREGELIVFDDSIEHEARNDGEQTRVVLIFDIWRPELTPEEKRFVTSVFEVIQSAA